MALASKWDCPTCTYLNWTSSLKCTLCGCHRPVEITPKATVAKIKSHTQNSLCSKSLGDGKTPQTSRWNCKECTFGNWPNASACIMCCTPRHVVPQITDPARVITKSRSILDYASGAVGGASSLTSGVTGIDVSESVHQHRKQRHPCHHHDNKSTKKWKCVVCTYENFPRSTRCVMCNSSRSTGSLSTKYLSTGATIGAERVYTSINSPSSSTQSDKKLSTSKEDLRQIRNRLSINDWLFINACRGIVNGDIDLVKAYLKQGGDRTRQLTSNEILVFNDTSNYSVGSSLIDLAIRFHQSDVLTLLLTPAPVEAHKRLPSQSNPDIAASIREEVSLSLRQHKGDCPCYYFTQQTTFTLPNDVKHFCDDVHKKVMEEIVDLNVLTELEEENSVINWCVELVDELQSKLYPLWNRTAGDCLLDSVLQATWGVSDRESTLRRALADSLVDCTSQFYIKWKEAELQQSHAQGFSLDEDQLKADWSSILSLADQKGKSLEQAHIFVLSHILRRPIIVYGVKIVKNFRGEKLGLVNFEGVYLPLLWESTFCWTAPIALAYTRGHFSALVSMNHCEESGSNNTSHEHHVTYLPLVDSEGKPLPLHFISEHQIGCDERLLNEYCDCHVTRRGILTAKQTVDSGHTSYYLVQLMDEWLDRFHKLDKTYEASSLSSDDSDS